MYITILIKHSMKKKKSNKIETECLLKLCTVYAAVTHCDLNCCGYFLFLSKLLQLIPPYEILTDREIKEDRRPEIGQWTLTRKSASNEK